MAKHIVIIQGNPDPHGRRFGHALADAYEKGAKQSGYEIRVINVANLEFPLLQTKEDFENGEPPESIRRAQETIGWADHLVIFYPLWLGAMPAVLKGFFEQVFRPAFVSGGEEISVSRKRSLKGKTARIIVTMGMPAFIYRWFYGAHTLKNLKRNILEFCGISSTKNTLIGMIENLTNAKREKWLVKIDALGRKGK